MFKRLRTERVHVPGLWPTEFANAMVLLERRRILRREQVAQIGAKAAQLVTNIAEPAAVPLLIEVARRHDLTAYDAAYLELAMRLSFPLRARMGRLPRRPARLACWPTDFPGSFRSGLNKTPGRARRFKELETQARASAALTRSGVRGTRRSRTPVASKNAFATAAGITRMEGSPAPLGGTSGRLISTTSMASGASPISRIG